MTPEELRERVIQTLREVDMASAFTAYYQQADAVLRIVAESITGRMPVNDRLIWQDRRPEKTALQPWLPKP